jgi:hypothetical protein
MWRWKSGKRRERWEAALPKGSAIDLLNVRELTEDNTKVRKEGGKLAGAVASTIEVDEDGLVMKCV